MSDPDILIPSNNSTFWGGMSAEFVEMTPERAETLLERNTSNRTPNRGRISSLIEQIENGDWDDNGASVVISADGTLIDGQHRLYAIAESGVSQVILLVRGARGESILTIDSGKVRSFKDYLEIEYPEKKNIPNTASAVTLLCRWDQGARASALFGSSQGSGRFRTDNHALSDYYTEHALTVDYIVTKSDSIGRKVALWKGFKRALVVATYVLSTIDLEDADDFFDKLVTGEGLEAGNPILAFRRQADRRAASNESTPVDMWLALLFKTWNAYRAGDSVQQVVWRRGGSSPEDFPEPR